MTVAEGLRIFTLAERPDLESKVRSLPDMFSESDAYVVPGALSPVKMELERDLGSYEEPNVWMRHPVMVGE